jgi:hypothetical protein
MRYEAVSLNDDYLTNHAPTKRVESGLTEYRMFFRPTLPGLSPFRISKIGGRVRMLNNREGVVLEPRHRLETDEAINAYVQGFTSVDPLAVAQTAKKLGGQVDFSNGVAFITPAMARELQTAYEALMLEPVAEGY